MIEDNHFFNVIGTGLKFNRDIEVISGSDAASLRSYRQQSGYDRRGIYS
jgi:hypothetical protein